MLTDFFFQLRDGGVPVSVKEWLALLHGLEANVAEYRVEDFYYLARTVLVKNEAHYDRFDRVFAAYFKAVASIPDALVAQIPAEWLRRQAELNLTDEEKAAIQALGGWEKLMETLRQRLEEQKGRHQGGSKWIGTAGTSPFGAHGFNPEGVRIGQEGSRNRRAVKVWDERQYRNLDDRLELGTRNIKVALRRLRKFAREGAAEELDLDDTVRSTARNAGWLDIRMVPERHNAVKLLLFVDIGGSMDDHVKVCEELFSAARSEFKHLEHFYFHNCVYETVWRDNRRRQTERTGTWEVLRTFGSDWRLVFVGDASMSPYEIVQPGGSVEHWNPEAGSVWL
ncbi:MAG: vWA domain-containing protein, partial [Betaproteobacteria bacterium]